MTTIKEKTKRLLEIERELQINGLPGTGKTYLAKMVAEEMDKKFIVVNVPHFSNEDEMYSQLEDWKDEGVKLFIFDELNRVPKLSVLDGVFEFVQKNEELKFVYLTHVLNNEYAPIAEATFESWLSKRKVAKVNM